FVSKGVVPVKNARLIRGSGVDPEVFRPHGELPRACNVVLPARMLADKGIVEAVEAVRFLSQSGQNVCLHLVGGSDPGNPHSLSVDRLNSWSDGCVVRWLGHIQEMPKLLTSMRIA